MSESFLAERKRLARRLRSLSRGLSFTWGQSAHRSDDVLDLSIDRAWDDEDRVEHLVTVFAGYPPGPLVRGLPWTVRRSDTGHIVRVGQTDGRGQFRLRGLPAAEYRLEVEGLLSSPAAGSLPRVALQAATELPLQPYHAEDGLVEAVVRLTPDGRWMLEATFQPEVSANRLAHFRVWDAEGRLLAWGYVGLYPVNEGGPCFGEVALDPGLDEHLATDPQLLVAAQPRETLTAAHREDLLRSLEASEHPACRAVLQEVLRQLPPEAAG